MDPRKLLFVCSDSDCQYNPSPTLVSPTEVAPHVFDVPVLCCECGQYMTNVSDPEQLKWLLGHYPEALKAVEEYHRQHQAPDDRDSDQGEGQGGDQQ